MKNFEPEAITQITEEETVWRSICIDDDACITFDFGRTKEGMYYQRHIRGNDVGMISLLDTVDMEPISRSEALGLREEQDYQWAMRPRLSQLAASLYAKGLLRRDVRGSVVGELIFDSIMRPAKYMFTVQRDGAVNLRVNDPTHIAKCDKITPLWRNYKLPKGTSMAWHDRRYPDEAVTTRALILDSREVVNTIVSNLHRANNELN